MSLLLALLGAGGATHVASGELVGQGAVVAGSATRFRSHATSGALTGPGATVAGAASRISIHATSGTITGTGSGVTGAAQRFTAHGTDGTLAGAGADMDGEASSFTVHSTSGDLIGPASELAGSSEVAVRPVVSVGGSVRGWSINPLYATNPYIPTCDGVAGIQLSGVWLKGSGAVTQPVRPPEAQMVFGSMTVDLGHVKASAEGVNHGATSLGLLMAILECSE